MARPKGSTNKKEKDEEIKSVVEDFNEMINSEGEVDKKEPVEFLSTGCIPLNLALSQKGEDGGVARGRIINLVGDGSSGKTITALEICAWAYYNIKNIKSKIFPDVKKLTIVYNNSEGVMDFPVAAMYGEEFFNDVEWTFFDTCEAFGRDVQRRLNAQKDGEAIIYVQDSIDSTVSEIAKQRLEKSIKSDKPEDGSYGLEKQKYFSQSFFNDLCARQQGKDATIILISQVRDNLNAGMFGKKHYRTGGKSLDFYTHQVAWLYHREKMKKTWSGNERVYGVKTLVKVERNKTAIPFREATFPVIWDFGIDNVMAMADFLYGPKDKLIEFDGSSMKKSELIDLAYENDDIKEKLTKETISMWESIEEHTATKRKPKYSRV